jgi:N-methylhydantoinase B/oxoprolinase/acetone carboxylase alpha subunit
MIASNSRTPEERLGDLDAQAGANRVGVARLAALAGAPFHEVVEYGERRMRAALASLPDGRWSFEDVMDSTGPRPEQQRPARIVLTVCVTGDSIVFDFTGTDAQRDGNVNAVEAVTVSAVGFAVRAVTDPTIPANGGALRPISVITEPGSIVAAVPPVAVGAGNVEISQRVADVCLGALAQAYPERVAAASQGTMNNIMIGGRGWVYYETVGGGQGARPNRDGMSGVHTAMTNTAQVGSPIPGQSGIHTGMTNTSDTPIEAFERTYPMKVLRYRLRRGSGGRGLADGGEGIEKVIQVLEPATLSLITERRRSRPWGLAGGEAGAPGENWLWPGGEESARVTLPDKVTVRLAAGDAVQILTPGGGGWGLSSD